MANAKRVFRWIKWISVLVILLSSAALAVYFLPFPWYVHRTMPMVYYNASGSPQEETGVLEVEGFMLCFLYKPDHFYGSMESYMSDATYKKGPFKAKMHIKFDADPKPDVDLAKDYRTIHFEKIDCSGDTETFIDYWMGQDRSPIVVGRFKQVILQKTMRSGGRPVIKAFCITDAKNVGKAQNVLLDFQLDNPDYPMLPAQ
ncbi:MAG: hypothetical protein IJ917_05045 [Firmicutes bacterium]|nr:hypothetical protein [Bacillota bacterium]